MYKIDEEDLEPQEAKRTRYRISRCCGNCKYYWYYAGNQRRGNCRLGSEIGVKKGKDNFARTDKQNRDVWPKTHITCVCDFHQYKSRVTSIAHVTDYCGAKLEEDL